VDEPWTILELAELAAETLAAAQPTEPSADAGTPSGPAPSGVARSARADMARSGPARANGRVRDVPNERLVRWYVTVGLVDPPLSRRGRVARYGRRHLLQLVAVKRRQAEGRSLAEIQAELAGATDDVLATIARVPATWPAPEARPTAPGRFWARQASLAQSPAAKRPGTPTAAAERRETVASAAAERGETVASAAAERGETVASAAAERGETVAFVAERPGPPISAAERREPSASAAAERGEAPASGAAGLVYGVRLGPGVTLLLEGADREPGPDDVAEIINAARPLLEELASRHLYADHLE
jgi:DNA-binding transcriptional MerR regulator